MPSPPQAGPARGGSKAPAPLALWAPRASVVDLVLPARSTTMPMRPAGEGWWSAPALPHGTDYAFSLDGGDPLPDPRSPWQPAGVHGPSRTFDATAFPFDAEEGGRWHGRDARGAVGYELHIGTFTPQGTLDAAIDRLDHLASLGVGMVELMPVAAFDGNRGWGYDGVCLYAVHEAYGGPAAGALAATRDHPGLQGSAVQRASRRARDRGDLDVFVLQDAVKHAPGECAVGATALQRQVDEERASLGCTHFEP